MINALIIGSHSYHVQIILLDITEFDVILGIDWLMQYGVYIDYHKCKLLVGQKDGKMITFRMRSPN